MTEERRDSARTGRRAEYAELTRQAILNVARDLFVEKGYFGTKVDDIAHMARVAPATVYAVGGGKSGLLRTLIEAGVTADDVPVILAALQSIPEPQELIRYLVHATRIKFEEWSDLMRQVVAIAAQEPSVREILGIAHEGLRGGLALTARRLQAMNALRPGMDAARATDLLWIHLCNAAYFIRTDDLGWSLDESEAWLNETLPAMLLEPGLT